MKHVIPAYAGITLLNEQIPRLLGDDVINMVVFPNAKINLGLNIIEKRHDGYHNIESCFYPIPLSDALEVIESKELSFTSTGIEIPGLADNNLCLIAYHQIKAQFDIPPVAIHLHKDIPIGAGLGGGSSDGAFMTKLLNDKFKLGINLVDQEKLAGQLGSDCPFFIRNKPTFVGGTGNVFTDINISLKGKYLVLVMPNIHVSTDNAYAGVQPQKSKHNLKSELEGNTALKFQQTVINDFEVSVFRMFPELEQIKAQLIKHGASYASMSGSGSTIFGIFESEPSFSSEHSCKTFQL